jgi:hypothetical protein
VLTLSTVLFDRETLRVTGVDREKFPFEVEVKNVNVEGLTKQKAIPIKREKVNEEGKPVYLLPQPDVKKVIEEVRYIETTEPTNSQGEPNTPVMVTQVNKIPLLDENNEIVTYQPTQYMQTTESVDYYGNPCEPIMVQKVDESGNVTEEQMTDKEGNPLYMGHMPVGEPIPCYTTETVEVQKEVNGELVYLEKVVEVVGEVYEEQPPIEITEDDERFFEGLPRALEDAFRYEVVTFELHPDEFTFEDIVKAKESQLQMGFLKRGILFERMDVENLFDTTDPEFNANISFDFINIPAGSVVKTMPITLPEPKDIVAVKVESDNPVKIEISDNGTDFYPLMLNNERWFSDAVTEVWVKFINEGDKPVTIESFAVLF